MLIAARDEDPAQASTKKLNREELRDEVLTIFLAGYETVANALSWTWLLLGQNPEAEARLHAEFDLALLDAQASRACPRSKTCPACPTPRWFSPNRCASIRRPGPWAARPSEDVEIGPYRVPRGTYLLLQPIHRPARSKIVPRTARLPPRALHRRGQGRAPKVRLLPFRRRRAPVHRRVLRLDGSNSGPGHSSPALETHGCRASANCTPAKNHPAAKIWNSSRSSSPKLKVLCSLPNQAMRSTRKSPPLTLAKEFCGEQYSSQS